jgi:hypothetical protein
MGSKWGSQRQFPNTFNLYSEDDYVRKDDPIPFISCYITDWDVKGLFFLQENKGSIPLYVSVSHWKGGGNLFRPCDMESALAELESGRYGNDEKCDNSVETFLNWVPVIINSQQWISYKTEEEAGNTTHKFIWVIPISDQHFLMFSFPTDHYRGRADDVVEAMKNFSTQIMQSVKITFPDWVLRLKAEAQEKWPDEQYSPTKEPLRWIREDLGRMSYGDYIAYMDKKNGLARDNETETDKQMETHKKTTP